MCMLIHRMRMPMSSIPNPTYLHRAGALSAGGVPQADHTVFPTAGQQPAVRAPGHAHHITIVALHACTKQVTISVVWAFVYRTWRCRPSGPEERGIGTN